MDVYYISFLPITGLATNNLAAKDGNIEKVQYSAHTVKCIGMQYNVVLINAVKIILSLSLFHLSTFQKNVW